MHHEDDPDRPEWFPPHVHFDRAAFEQHVAQSHVTYSDYSSSHHALHGAEASKRLRVYLDQNYWIFMRDVRLGRTRQPEHKQLYDLLSSAADAGTLICPLSDTVLSETLKQSDDSTRLATAETIDHLSRGFCLRPTLERPRIEFGHFLRTVIGGHAKPLPPGQLVWTFPAFVYGEMVPRAAFPPAVLEGIRKSLFDVFRQMGTRELILSLGFREQQRDWDSAEHVTHQNRERQAHREDFKTFEKALEIELAGSLDVLGPELASVLHRVMQEQPEWEPKFDATAAKELVKPAGAIVYNLIRLGKVSTQLPGIHIGASLHAAGRYKGRPYNRGDLHDHHHAAAALPYCNVFLCESTLGTLIAEPPLKFDALYGCRVAWKIRDAIALVEELLAQS